MLWLCLHFPLLPAEAQGLCDPLNAVTASHAAQRWLITPAAGLPAGIALGDALARQPALRAWPRRPAAERDALQALAHWIYRYGSPVTAQLQELPEPGRCPRALLWAEVGASRRLFGGLEALRAQLGAELRELAQAATLAVAPTRSGAALLASAGGGDTVLSLAELPPRLAALPVQALAWPQAELERLQGMGLRRLGDLFALPRAGLARRIGAQRLRELDGLRGLAPEPLQAITPPAVFRRRFELPGEVESLEGLLFPLRRLSVELQHWLRSRDVGLRALTLQCEHAQRRRTGFELRFLSAHRDAARIFAALRERLQRTPPASAVRALLLSADDFAAVAGAQRTLFDDEPEAQLQWTQTVERLAARLGESALWTPVAVEDHRPERAGPRTTPAVTPAPAPHAAPARPRPRPLWLLPAPLPLPSAPVVHGAPERIESGAWDGADTCRDYYVTDWRQARAWVFRDHASGRWYLHGWFG